jgi:hypothetical protein
LRLLMMKILLLKSDNVITWFTVDWTVAWILNVWIFMIFDFEMERQDIQGDWKVTPSFKFFITLKQQKISSWFFHHFEAWTMAFCARWNKSIDRLIV